MVAPEPEELLDELDELLINVPPDELDELELEELEEVPCWNR